MAWEYYAPITTTRQGWSIDPINYRYRVVGSTASDAVLYIDYMNGIYTHRVTIWKGTTIDISTYLAGLTSPGTVMFATSSGSMRLEYEKKNSAPTTPGEFTQPTGVLRQGTSSVISWGASTDAEGNLANYMLEQSVDNGGWSAIAQPTSPSYTHTIPTARTIRFRVKAVDREGAASDYRESSTYTINANPTLTLETENNITLYENDVFLIKGSAKDIDNGNIINVRFSINGSTGRALDTYISDGLTAKTFEKKLTFKGGRLYDGATDLSGALSEGTAHILRVWAEDDQGGKSTISERTFYVVPNRPPVLSVNPFELQSDLINTEKVAISGIANDPDGNELVVRYRLNEGLNTQIHSGPSGPWSFDLQLSKLQEGENTIVVEAIDTYDFKITKTIKVNKTANRTPTSQSVQRYKIVPPAGSAQGVLLWTQRDEGQEIQAEISMTNGTEQEKFVPLTLDTSAPVAPGIIEDFFLYRGDAPAENIVLKLSWTGDKPITLLTGALQQ